MGLGNWKKKLTDVGNDAVNLVEDVGNEAAELARKAAEEAAAAAAALKAAEEAALRAAEEAARAAEEAARRAAEAALRAAEEAAQALAEAAAREAEAVRAAAEAATQAAAEAAAQAAAEAARVAQEVTTRISAAAEAMASACEAKLQELAESAVDGAWGVDDLDLLAGALDADELANRVAEASEWAVGELVEIGEQVQEELTRFVERMLADIERWVVFIYGERSILQAVAEGDEDVCERLRVERRVLDGPWFVASDVHMFCADNLDRFNVDDDQHVSNARLYRAALRYYAGQGYGLIENGDVEDFWMSEDAMDAIRAVAGQMPWPNVARYIQRATTEQLDRQHALKIFLNNERTYATVRGLFHDRLDRNTQRQFVRIYGNHDDRWAKDSMADLLDGQYPGLRARGYLVLVDPAGEAQVIVTHGHQTDAFNARATSWRGGLITAAGSLVAPSRTWTPEQKWRTDSIYSKDKHVHLANTLQDVSLSGFEGMSEPAVRRMMREIWDDDEAPLLVLGHTHHIRWQSPWGDGLWTGYANSGTAGRWQGVVFGLEIEPPGPDERAPRVRPVAWLASSDRSSAERFVLATDDDHSDLLLNQSDMKGAHTLQES